MALTTSEMTGRASVKGLKPRLLVVMAAVVVAGVLLVSRLYALQIVRGEELSSKGQQNFVQEVRIPHDRGIIYDRYGRIIVDNRPSLDAQVTPAFLGKLAEATVTIERLSELVALAPEEKTRVLTSIKKARGLDRFQPVLVKRDLDPEQIEAIEAQRSVFLLDGVDIVEGRRRTYRYGSLGAHLLGYVNEIDPDTLEAERKAGNPKQYRLGDAIGRAGVERTYESELRGRDGFEKTVVDAKGRRQHDTYIEQLLGTERRVAPTPGHNLYLTIDLELQQRAEAAFHGQSGAVVAMDPKSGSLLVVASFPSFDPNLVSGALGKQEKQRLDNDVLKPWLNRSIQGQYAPGSTFKVVTAMAALAQKATGPKEKVYCPGYFRIGRHTWRCHKDSGHGYVDLKEALKVSCDTYFYTMAGRIGINAIADMARRLSFGARTGIALRDEKNGIVPDEAYHNKVDASTGGYQRGMAINTAIGQGSLLVTPLQQAAAYAVVANGGTVWKPQMVDRIESADFRVTRRFLPEARLWRDDPSAEPSSEGAPLNEVGRRDVSALANIVRHEVLGDAPSVVVPWAPTALRTVPLPADDLAEVRLGLFAVTSEPGGTAYWRRSKQVTMAGKTGTAQVMRLGRDRLKPEEMSYFERDHAWFVAYAPAEDPEIVVAVLNEHSGHGGSEAAPIAVAVIDAFYELERARQAQSAPIAERLP